MLFRLVRWPLANRRRSFKVPTLDANAQFSSTLANVGGYGHPMHVVISQMSFSTHPIDINSQYPDRRPSTSSSNSHHPARPIPLQRQRRHGRPQLHL